MKKLRPYGLALICMFTCYYESGAQIRVGGLTGAQLNAIQTSVPFLTITPDGRSSGMGDAGVASAPDVNSQHWNVAKYAFADGRRGLAASFSPWIRNLIPGVWHLYLSAYYKISDHSALSSSFRYFSLGMIDFTSIGMPGAYLSPREFALDVGYSRKFTDQFSGGAVLRYVQSDIFLNNPNAAGSGTSTGRTMAADLALYYEKDIQIQEKDALWALGLHISNMGPPVSYGEDDEGLPIPTNLRLGGRFTFNINEYNSLTAIFDCNKLLVPSPPVYNDSIYQESGELVVERGKDKPGSVFFGMFQSFYDAPGIQLSDGSYSVAREELMEIAISTGIEYWHKKRFAIRSGYFHEDPAKGNRQYFTFGLGFRFGSLSWDLSYLLPRNGANSPLFNTFRLSFTAELRS